MTVLPLTTGMYSSRNSVLKLTMWASSIQSVLRITIAASGIANEVRMKEIAELQRHIGSYNKTKDIYRQYRKSGWSKNFYAAHESNIIIHKAAKKSFDNLGLKKLPAMQNLVQEYVILTAENKKLYSEQKLARQKMIELLTAKKNTAMILGVPKQKQRENEIGNR